MTQAEHEAIVDIVDQIEEKVELRDRLEAQRNAEDDPMMRWHINLWIAEANNEISCLRADLAALQSTAILIDIGRGRNLSEMG